MLFDRNSSANVSLVTGQNTEEQFKSCFSIRSVNHQFYLWRNFEIEQTGVMCPNSQQNLN